MRQSISNKRNSFVSKPKIAALMFLCFLMLCFIYLPSQLYAESTETRLEASDYTGLDWFGISVNPLAFSYEKSYGENWLNQYQNPRSEHWHNTSTPITVQLSIDHLPIVGEPVTISCEVTSILDAPNTKAQLELPHDTHVLDGSLIWEGDLSAGDVISFSATILFDSSGNKSIFCRALRVIDEDNVWGDLSPLYLSIGDIESAEGFSPIPPEEGDIAELISPGDGQIINDSPGSSAPACSGDLTITGRFQFYDRNDNLASEQLGVQIVYDGTVNQFAYCVTDIDGYFTCGPFPHGCDNFQARLLTYTNFAPYNDKLVVINPDLPTPVWGYNIYGFKTDPFSFEDGTHDIGTWVVPNNSNNELAFWIISDLIKAWKYVWFNTGSSQSPQETAGPATVEWKIDSIHGDHYHPGGNIHLTGNAALSASIVLHEYGHNVMYNVYGLIPGWCPDPHYINLSSNVQCAWTEGWANFFAIAVNNDPVFRWASGASENLETPTWGTPGWQEGVTVEGRVAGALWDMLDSVNDGYDQYSEGSIINIWDTFYHEFVDRFSEYWSDWQSRGHNSSDAVVMSIYQNTIDFRVTTPNIKANGSDVLLSIPQSDTLSVTIELASGNRTGQNADWWVLANTPMGWYHYVLPAGWSPGQVVTHQGPLFELTPREVLNMSGLPTGPYTFYFGVDMVMNGSIDMGEMMYYDYVPVNIYP